MIRIERRAGDFVVSTEIPDDADRTQVSAALWRLDRLVPVISDTCPGCRAWRGAVHEPHCPYATGDLVARAYAGRLGR